MAAVRRDSIGSLGRRAVCRSHDELSARVQLGEGSAFVAAYRSDAYYGRGGIPAFTPRHSEGDAVADLRRNLWGWRRRSVPRQCGRRIARSAALFECIRADRDGIAVSACNYGELIAPSVEARLTSFSSGCSRLRSRKFRNDLAARDREALCDLGLAASA